MSRSCVVIGGGVAGLAAAYRLSNAGVRVTVLESASHVGGRTRTERVGDFVVNTGAQSVTTFHTQTRSLLRELRLPSEKPPYQPVALATPYGKIPLEVSSLRGVRHFPLLSLRTRLRLLRFAVPLLPRRRIHVADLPSLARVDRGGNARRWGLRVMGRDGYDYLLRTAIEPLLFFGAHEASAALGRASMRHAQRWDFLVVRDGMGALADSLAARVEVRTGCWVSAIEERDDRIVVTHSGGTIEADYAISACPASSAARFEGTLSEEDRTDLASVRYAPTVTLFFGYEREVTVQHSAVTSAGPGRHPIATIFTLSRWVRSWVPEGKELICIYSSAWRAREILDQDPSQMVSTLRADAEEIFGRLADPDWIRTYPRSEATVVPVPGHYRRMLRFLRRPRRRLLFAGDWLTGSTIEGAVRTGLEAAQRIVDERR